jgi:hypothetical protein
MGDGMTKPPIAADEALSPMKAASVDCLDVAPEGYLFKNISAVRISGDGTVSFQNKY